MNKEATKGDLFHTQNDNPRSSGPLTNTILEGVSDVNTISKKFRKDYVSGNYESVPGGVPASLPIIKAFRESMCAMCRCSTL